MFFAAPKADVYKFGQLFVAIIRKVIVDAIDERNLFFELLLVDKISNHKLLNGVFALVRLNGDFIVGNALQRWKCQLSQLRHISLVRIEYALDFL